MREISINKKFSESIISIVFVIFDAFIVTCYIIREREPVPRNNLYAKIMQGSSLKSNMKSPVLQQ